MSEKKSIAVIGEQLDAAAAVDIARAELGEHSILLERKFYYPYYRFEAICRAPLPFGRRILNISCLVDGINNVGATADPFEARCTVVPTESVLAFGVSMDEAAHTARRYLMHHLARRLRVISNFGIEVGNPHAVYKAFRLARSRSSLIVIDSTTGLTHAIRKDAA